MLSRIADSLFWMNRYMERADGLLRTLRYGYIASFDTSKEGSYNWQEALDIFSGLEEEQRLMVKPQTTTVLKHMLYSTEETNSLKVMVTRARENARGAQDHITKEVWEAINQIYHRINSKDTEIAINEGAQVPMLDQLIEDSLMYYGVTDITMPRSMGWQFMNLGRYSERCLQTLDIVDARFSRMDYDIESAQHILYWRNMLLSLSGYELFLKTYRTGNHTENIIDMIFFNTQFPRSIFYSVKRIGHYLQKILDENKHENTAALERMLGKLYSSVAYASREDIQEKGLEKYIHFIKEQIYELQHVVGHTFFSYY